jgi:hypothetical protein
MWVPKIPGEEGSHGVHGVHGGFLAVDISIVSLGRDSNSKHQYYFLLAPPGQTGIALNAAAGQKTFQTALTQSAMGQA